MALKLEFSLTLPQIFFRGTSLAVTFLSSCHVSHKWLDSYQSLSCGLQHDAEDDGRVLSEGRHSDAGACDWPDSGAPSVCS